MVSPAPDFSNSSNLVKGQDDGFKRYTLPFWAKAPINHISCLVGFKQMKYLNQNWLRFGAMTFGANMVHQMSTGSHPVSLQLILKRPVWKLFLTKCFRNDAYIAMLNCDRNDKVMDCFPALSFPIAPVFICR